MNPGAQQGIFQGRGGYWNFHKWTILSKWDSPAKTVYIQKTIPPKWDLTCVKVRSHMVKINPSSYNDLFLKSEIHHFTEVSLRWDVLPGWDDFYHINKW